VQVDEFCTQHAEKVIAAVALCEELILSRKTVRISREFVGRKAAARKEMERGEKLRVQIRGARELIIAPRSLCASSIDIHVDISTEKRAKKETVLHANTTCPYSIVTSCLLSGKEFVRVFQDHDSALVHLPLRG